MSRPFDVCGPLPTGVTVLEASAGTGKTYTIAALAARYVAEGTPLDRLLLVTFTRMATGELRDRVRERLVSAERDLTRVLAGVSSHGMEDVVRLLADGPPEEVRKRRDRLVRALADFDSATIATTHGFCQEVLGGLGVAGDVEPGVTFVEDLSDLVDEVVDDLYVRRYVAGSAPGITLAQALEVARAAVDNPSAPIEPADVAGDGGPAVRARLADRVRRELKARKLRLSVMTYDDLLTRLDETLSGAGGELAAKRLRTRYRVVLVDEFQDTDPVQWNILRRAFGSGGVTLVLIGDPKQAIYAFRGADVFAYLEAAKTAGSEATLEVNWRSDQGLIDAYDAMFGGAKLGHPRIVYRTVRAAEANRAPRLHGAPVATPLRVRVVDRDSVGTTAKGYAGAPPAREHIASDLAADLVGLLSSNASIEVRSAGRIEPIRPGHVAVLVRRHRDAALVREALERVGVPAVINGAGSVFATAEAREWLRLLEAIERPASTLRAHAATMTSFLGWTAEDVAAASDEAWEEVHRRLHVWAAVLRRRGLASLTETITLIERLPGRVLSVAEGERRLTDLRHVGQLLHGAAATERLGTAALTSWLRRRIAAAEQEGDEERSRRLESDAEAVQVLTIHRSKGLEFPVVYLPYLWESTWVDNKPVPVAYHDPARDHQRMIDVGLEGADYRRHQKQHLEEQRGEDLRLAYVALTRAQHQAIVWWAGSWGGRDSALSRLLFARDQQGNVAAGGPTPSSDADAIARFQELAADAPGCVSVERSELRGLPVAWSGALAAPTELSAASFDRPLDRDWRRTSYSDITAAAHEARVASEPEESVVTDEPEDEPRPATLPAASGLGPGAGAGSPGAQPAGLGAPSGGAPGADPASPGSPGAGSPSAHPASPGSPGAGSPSAHPAGAAGVRLSGSADSAEAALAKVPSLLAAGPGGTAFGTFAHTVLEATDFAAPDLDAELAATVAAALARRPVDIGDRAAVIAGLRAAIETPLGPLVGGRRLRDIRRADRLDELTFELPLAGGDAPAGQVTPAAIGAVLREQLGPGDPLAGYADRLDDPDLRASVRGYLTGSIDLVWRVGDAFAIADYKTNWLAAPGEPLTAWHHRPAALSVEMERAHYGLQALLYIAALHRYLRWRLAGYDPERHLAGVLYLFVRGMTGPDTPTVGGTPCGVFAWRPPAALVVALSDVLDRGAKA